MMTTLAVICSLAMAQATSPALACPVMPDHAVPAEAKAVEYRGIRVQFCCPGCEPKFAANPEKYLAEAAAANKVVGQFLFDVTSGELLNMRRATYHHTYKGVRYSFSKQENFNKFKANPGRFVDNAPKKEALFCPVMKEAVASYGSASHFVDYNGVRYYLCCGGCVEPFRANPGNFIRNAANYVKEPKVIQPAPAQN